MKKIYVFSQYPSKGNPTHYYFIKHRINILKKYYDVTLITINNWKHNTKSKLQVKKVDGYNLVELYIKKINIPKLRYFYKERQIQKLLHKYIKENPPDIIHVHFSSYYSWIISSICYKQSIPYIITEHASFFEERINHIYFGPRMKKALLNANHIITVSPYLKNIIKRYIPKRISIIPNVINTDKFSIQNQNSIEGKTPKMISIGKLDMNDKKGYELLLNSLNKLQMAGERFQCEIIGNGPYKEYLEEMIERYKLYNVKLIGDVENDLLPLKFAEADFFVSSSKLETFGVVIIEAMSCGLPIVATRSGGPEGYISEEIGILAEQNVDSLSEKLSIMIHKFNSYDPLLIREKVVNNFSENIYLEKKQKIIKKIIKND